MKLLLELIAKLFGKGAVSKTIGSRTNVIKIADNDAKRFIQKELNILEAGDEAVRKGLKDAETLIPDIPKMNDQEILTFTGNLRRLDQRVNPPQKPAAEVLDMSTQQKVSPEGIEKLADEKGIPSDVDPRSPLGSVMRRVKQMQLEGKNLADEFGMTDDLKKGLKGLSDPIPPQIQKEGLVKATANDIMIADIKSGKFPATKEMEQDILQGSSKSLDYFRRFYGEDALEVLDSLGTDLAKMRTSREAADFAKKQYNFEPKMDRAPGSFDPEDPEGFAMGGRVGYAYGSGLKLIKLLNKTKKSLKQAIKESADDIIPTGDSKLDADMAVDNMLEKLGVDRDAVDGYDILDAYSEAYKTVTGSMLKTRKSASVFSEQYLKKIDDEIIKEGLYTRKEWAKAPETIKNKIRGQMDPDWKEANFGEDYDFDQVRGKELEEGMVTRPKVLEGGIGSLSDEEGMEMMNALYPEGKIRIGGQELDLSDIANDVKLMNEKGLRGNRAGDYDKFVEMQLSGELGPQQQMKTIKMELRNKYSRYLDDETMDVIQASNDPQKVAEVYANVREAALLSDRGVPTEEIVDTIIKTPRTKQADGTGPQGLANLLGV